MLGVLTAVLLAGAAAPPLSPFASESVKREAASPQTSPSADSSVDSVAIDSDLTQRMTVLVDIGGQGPFAFLVDTGSERTVISRQLATQLKLPVGDPTRVHSVLGTGTVATVDIPRLAVGRQALSVNNAPTFEQRHIGADGMLGIDSLRSQRVMFDFKAGEMRITPSRQAPVEKIDENTIIVRARARGGRLILTKVTLDGISIAAIVDTGSQVSIGNPALLRRLQRSRNIAIEAVPVEGARRGTIEAVTGEVKDVHLAHIPRLNLGGAELEEVRIAFADAHIFKELGYKNKPALLLGIDTMRSFDQVSIDFAQKKVRFVVPGLGMIEGYQMAAR